MTPRRDQVPSLERLKAGFLSEYKELCQRFNLMVIMAEKRPKGYLAFHVVDITDMTHELEKAILEMNLNPMSKAAPPENEDDIR